MTQSTDINLQKLTRLLSAHTGADFEVFRPAFIGRLALARQHHFGLHTLEKYLALLEKDPTEITVLANCILSKSPGKASLPPTELHNKLYAQIPGFLTDSAVVMFDQEGTILLAEGPLLHDLELEQLSGRNVREVFEAKGQSYFHTLIERVLKGQQFTSEYVIGAFICECSFSPLMVQQLEGGVMFIQNVTPTQQYRLAVDSMIQSVPAHSGEAFFEGLVHSLGQILEVSHVLVGEYNDDFQSVTTRAYWEHGSIRQGFSYELIHSPCRFVFEGKTVICSAQAQELYPEDDYFREHQIQSYIGFPLFDSQNRPAGLIAIMHTRPLLKTEFVLSILKLFASRVEGELERRKALQALQNSEQLYRSIARNIPNGLVIVFDKQFRIQLYEGQMADILPGYQEWIVGKNPFEEEEEFQLEWEFFRPYYEQTLQGKAQSLEYLVKKLGKEVVISMIPLRDEQGQITGGLSLVTDITALKKTQHYLKEHVEALSAKNQQLQEYIQSNLELEKFAYVASHDLRAPLRNISGFAQLLNMRYRDQLDEEAREYITFIVDGVQKMSGFIDDLLDYSRVTSQRDLAFEYLDTRTLVQEVVQHFQTDLSDKKVALQVGQLPEKVWGIKNSLLQVFMNLLDNALKFRRQTGQPKISIVGGSFNGHWRFEVEDNGIGIESHHFERIFSPFKRLHTDETYKGSGIGLAICKHIVQQHGGEISVASSPGLGSRFTFTLAKPQKK